MVGMIAYAVRLVAFSYVSNVYYALMIEVLEGITFTLMMIVITNYAAIISSKDLIATMQSAWAVLHFSVGRAAGSGVGGVMVDNLGPRLSYQLFALVCLIAAVLQLITYLTCIRKKENKRKMKAKKDRGDAPDIIKCNKLYVNEDSNKTNNNYEAATETKNRSRKKITESKDKLNSKECADKISSLAKEFVSQVNV